MVKYEKPKCDCGEDLVVHYVDYVQYEQKIKKDGTLYKKKDVMGDNVRHSVDILYCKKCMNSYESDWDLYGENAFKYKRGNLL